MASTDSRPVPIKNTAFRAVFPILDADGDLVTGAAGLDSEVSKDQGTFADCTNEATEIATSSGMYYLDLTSTEMNADCVAVIVKTSTSGAKTTVLVLYPQESGDIKVDVQSFGGSAGTFSGGRPEVNVSHNAGTAITAASGRQEVNISHVGGTAITATGGRMEVKADSLGTQAKADVNAEVVDGLNVDTVSEQAQGAPPAAPTMRQMLSYLYMLFIRNKKSVDASASPAVEKVYANDDSTVVFKRDIADSSSITTASKSVSG